MEEERSELAQQIAEITKVRLLLQQDRRSLSGVVAGLRKENKRLRDQLRSLRHYIGELEKFQTTAEIEDLKKLL